MHKSGIIVTGLALCMLPFACVPAKKLKDEQARSEQYRYRLRSAEDKIESLQAERDSLQQQVRRLSSSAGLLRQDTAEMSRKYRQLEEMNEELNAIYEKMAARNKALLSNATSEKFKLNNELADREARVRELEAVLARKDSAAKALKDRITKALMGFDKSDLTVTNKNGKIYVSLAEKLLFRSGSTVVDPKGVNALQRLAAALVKDPGIHIMVEGHTDNVPLSGTGAMKDNWDLSVLRATSIVRILTGEGVDPGSITAAGRGQYLPVADNDNAAGRALNRRTEIILTPNLDELFKILGTD